MKGKITKFFQDKGFGFIKDENGESRFFHISHVKGLEDVFQGTMVEFTPNTNEKGLNAIDIKVFHAQKQAFIAFDDVRIKLNNIKNYGLKYETITEIISEETKSYSTGEKLLNRTAGVVWTILGASEGLAGAAKRFSEANWDKNYTDVKQENVTYKILYITTYQGDNYTFHEKYKNFSINEKMNELDIYFNV